MPWRAMDSDGHTSHRLLVSPAEEHLRLEGFAVVAGSARLKLHRAERMLVVIQKPDSELVWRHTCSAPAQLSWQCGGKRHLLDPCTKHTPASCHHGTFRTNAADRFNKPCVGQRTPWLYDRGNPEAFAAREEAGARWFSSGHLRRLLSPFP